MRITPSLLCFFLIFFAAQAADPAPLTTIDTYISARDRYVAQVCALPAGEARDKAEERRISELGLLLPVPPWHAPGWQTKTEYTVTALCKGDIALGRLDGLEYFRGATSVIVTTKPLVARWLVDHRNWWPDKSKNVPASMTAAFRSEAFWTQAVSTDAATYLHGLVLLKSPPGADLAIAQLAALAQDLVMDRGPDTMLAVVMRGDRVFLAEEPLKEKLALVPFCKKAMDQMLARGKTEKDVSRSETLEEKADREYRACFAKYLPTQKNYAAVQKQAQALVDLLH